MYTKFFLKYQVYLVSLMYELIKHSFGRWRHVAGKRVSGRA